jgi:hypothetical protein
VCSFGAEPPHARLAYPQLEIWHLPALVLTFCRALPTFATVVQILSAELAGVVAHARPPSNMLHLASLPLSELPLLQSPNANSVVGAKKSLWPFLIKQALRLLRAGHAQMNPLLRSFGPARTNYTTRPEEVDLAELCDVLTQHTDSIFWAIGPQEYSANPCWAYNPDSYLGKKGLERWDHGRWPTIVFTTALDEEWGKATSDEDRWALLAKGLEGVWHEIAHNLLRGVCRFPLLCSKPLG